MCCVHVCVRGCVNYFREYGIRVVCLLQEGMSLSEISFFYLEFEEADVGRGIRNVAVISYAWPVIPV